MESNNRYHVFNMTIETEEGVSDSDIWERLTEWVETNGWRWYGVNYEVDKEGKIIET